MTAHGAAPRQRRESERTRRRRRLPDGAGHTLWPALPLVLGVLAPAHAAAQSAGPLDMSWSGVSGGTGTVSGGGFGFVGSIGGPAVGIAGAGGLEFIGGWWSLEAFLPNITLRALFGGAPRTMRVLYLGNSRVSRPGGFAFDGLEDIVFDEGRLAGNGFVTPLDGVQQTAFDVKYLLNAGHGMTRTDPTWHADDPVSVLHAHNGPALRLTPGRVLKMANLGNDVAMLPRTAPVEITVQHLAGPDRGTYRLVPVEVRGSQEVVHAHTPAEVNCAASTHAAAFVRVMLPPMVNPLLNRAFLLEGVAGDCTIFAVNAEGDAPGGVSISEMAIGGEGYDTQAHEENCPAVSWTAFVAAFRPDVVLWQYAANQGHAGAAPGARVLMDRVAAVNPYAVHAVLIDTPSPRSNSRAIVERSIEWAREMEGYRRAIVIDPRPYLPPDFTALEGTGQLGAYFQNSVHENRLGARVVGEAVWAALRDFAHGQAPPQPCWPDCDPSSGPRVLDIFDFLCFQNRYAANDPYACDCDTSSGPGVCDIFDFLCFQNAYGARCEP